MYNLLKNKKKFLDNIYVYDLFFQKLRGLMFYLKKPRKAIALTNTKSIHMFFVFFKLAIIVLDQNLKVIDKFIIKPWRISKYYPQAEIFLESPNLSIIQNITKGDKLEFKEIGNK